jgi:hypothetical protein
LGVLLVELGEAGAYGGGGGAVGFDFFQRGDLGVLLRVQFPDMRGECGGLGVAAFGCPDSFRRARTRAPIPGEARTPDGRPAWTPGTLRNWNTARNRPGARDIG